MVSFDSQGKITAIRQSWDQGSLLKQLDVIGKTGRNWPIRDSKEQLRLITSSLNAVGVDAARPAEAAANRSRTNTNNATRDPHASLALFAPREEAAAQVESVISPYAGTRPRQRTFTELFGDENVEEPGSPSSGRDRSMSPSKAVAPKAGARNFQPSRLFDTEEEENDDVPENKQPSPDRFYRPNAKKYDHFDFADGSEPQDAPRPAPPQKTKSKADSNWSFDDFATPAKVVPTRGLHRAQDVRHWSNDAEDSVAETPAKKPTQQVKGRRDAEAHFDLVDDGLPTDQPRIGGRPRGTAQNTGLGLYENNLYNEDGSKPGPGPGARALGNITNLEDRRKDFAPHFEMTDDSPAHGNGTGFAQVKQDDFGKASNDHKKAVKMMESNWDTYDVSPNAAAQKENSNPNRGNTKPKETGITIAGDGMGSRKGAGRNYLTGNENAIGTAGDGMGGKKGSGRAWAIGDESDEEIQKTRGSGPGKKQVPQAASNFWDF
jgi:hypothetical protein